MKEYSQLLNSQKYALLWNDEKSIDIVRNTLRIITDKLTTTTGIEAYNKTFQLNNKGLKIYIETKLSKKLFLEVFQNLI